MIVNAVRFFGRETWPAVKQFLKSFLNYLCFSSKSGYSFVHSVIKHKLNLRPQLNQPLNSINLINHFS